MNSGYAVSGFHGTKVWEDQPEDDEDDDLEDDDEEEMPA